MNPRRGSYPTPNPVALQLTDRARRLLAGKRVVDAYDYVCYDTLRYKPATAVSTADVLLFTVGFGQATQVANSAGEAYTKTKADTNLQEGNRLPAGQTFIVDSIQFMVQFTGSTDTTYPTSGPGTEFPTDTTAAAAISSTNLITAILEQSYVQFWVGEKAYEEGPLWAFPSDFGVMGFAGAGSGATTAVNALTNTEVAVNNGFGHARVLAVPRQIPELVNFYIKLNFIQAFTITRQLAIRAILRGILYRPVQ
jgi:hypothetical protein